MAGETDFEVLLSDYNVSVDEWIQANQAPKSALPRLNALEQDAARKLGLRKEEYQRNVLADRLGEMRLRSRGEALGRAVEEMLRGFGGRLRLKSVRGDVANERWVCRIGAPDRIVAVAIPRDLVDDALDSGAREDSERLNGFIVAELTKCGLDRKQ